MFAIFRYFIPHLSSLTGGCTVPVHAITPWQSPASALCLLDILTGPRPARPFRDIQAFTPDAGTVPSGTVRNPYRRMPEIQCRTLPNPARPDWHSSHPRMFRPCHALRGPDMSIPALTAMRSGSQIHTHNEKAAVYARLPSLL